MALFIPMDVDFPSDPKFLKAGPLAGYLYWASIALAKRTKSDGFIAVEQLPSLCVGFPGKPDTHASRLVDSGLWVEADGGWIAPAYVKRNPTRAQVDEKAERKRAASVKANHDRWHSDAKRSDDCPHCIRPPSDSDPTSDQSGYGSHPPSTKTKTEPEPETEPVAADAVVTETARRIADRRRRGHDIGPALELIIRQDVERDLGLREPEAKPMTEVDHLEAHLNDLMLQADLVDGPSRDALLEDARQVEREIKRMTGVLRAVGEVAV